MKIGIVFCSLGQQEYLGDALEAWNDARATKLDGHEFEICAVSIPFKEYKDVPSHPDQTLDILYQCKRVHMIDELFIEPKFILEHEARDLAVQYLLGKKVDLIWLVDGDEIYTLENISAILEYVIAERYISVFKLSLKNYVFDESTYLKEPFTPNRIFRTLTNGFALSKCFWDNEMLFRSTTFLDNSIRCSQLPNKTVPQNVAFIDHFSWMNNSKSLEKINYQVAHFGDKSCSYKWDEEKGLEFNEDFYKNNGMSLPEIVKE